MLPSCGLAYPHTQRGMFSDTGLSSAQVDWQRKDCGVCWIRSGRICIASLNHGNVERSA